MERFFWLEDEPKDFSKTSGPISKQENFYLEPTREGFICKVESGMAEEVKIIEKEKIVIFANHIFK